mmetsp:Transcript_91968/g.268983  ORF Transcript_91968/g.268983 Transcript_91968/m.268983 type:complete len:88 (+) Transcript_91968:1322-1585(+)
MAAVVGDWEVMAAATDGPNGYLWAAACGRSVDCQGTLPPVVVRMSNAMQDLKEKPSFWKPQPVVLKEGEADVSRASPGLELVEGFGG